VERGKTRRDLTKRFSWVSEYGLAMENGELQGVEIVLAEWLYETAHNYHVLTLDPRYFQLRGATERWLYIYARRSAGNPNGLWKETLKNLYRKSASQQDFKHFKSTLKDVIERNALPGLKLKCVKSVKGEDMLLMERIKDKSVSVLPPEQLTLIEKTPHEQHWENLLEVMKRRYGEATTKSWFARVEFRSFENRILALSAPTKFHADWMVDNYKHPIRSVWESYGHEVEIVIFLFPPKVAKTA
jgi:plasmid replication initiation protein